MNMKVHPGIPYPTKCYPILPYLPYPKPYPTVAAITWSVFYGNNKQRIANTIKAQGSRMQATVYMTRRRLQGLRLYQSSLDVIVSTSPTTTFQRELL